ncbi:hypothetical protein FACS189462_5360 [Spirochaetia bacterium]|nr:hypothetical protein FACS189462_5360 [Spirochaetia bacterium]
MGLSEILDEMVKKAEEIYAASADYQKDGKRGFLIAEIKNGKIEGQWDAASRPFGTVSKGAGNEGELIINNGTSFEAMARGKVAYSRRTGKNSGANYYEVRGAESWWKGAVVSKDGKCICAFSGLMGYDDVAIAEAGIALYEKNPS